MKSVLISIQPYWVFLIIAKAMGWKIDKEKTIELRTTRPRDKNWNSWVEIYCSKNKKSFNQIPKEYQALMQRCLGKVVGKWFCNKIDSYVAHEDNKDYWDLSVKEWEDLKQKSCLTIPQILDYSEHSDNLYGWHISDLKIYDKPKELSEFYSAKCDMPCENKKRGFNMDFCMAYENGSHFCKELICEKKRLSRPPQSWCYIESGV